MLPCAMYSSVSVAGGPKLISPCWSEIRRNVERSDTLICWLTAQNIICRPRYLAPSGYYLSTSAVSPRQLHHATQLSVCSRDVSSWLIWSVNYFLPCSVFPSTMFWLDLTSVQCARGVTKKTCIEITGKQILFQVNSSPIHPPSLHY